MAGCGYCKDETSVGTNYGERRRVDVPDGGWVHFGCFSDWLVDDGLKRWMGPLTRHERHAMKIRLGLPLPRGRASLTSLQEAAEKVGYTGPWLSQLQLRSMRTFGSKVSAANSQPLVLERSRDMLLQKSRLERAVELAEEFVKSVRGLD